MVDTRRLLFEQFAKELFEECDAWEGALVWVGRLPSKYKEDKALRFVRAPDVRIKQGPVVVYGEVVFGLDALEDMVPGRVIEILCERMAEDLADKGYRAELGLGASDQVVVVGTVDMLLSGRKEGMMVSLRMKLANV